MSEDVFACPECDSASVEAVRGTSYVGHFSEHDYRCNDCGHLFDEPVERPSKHAGGASRVGLAKRLVDADPDDVGRPRAGGDD